MQFSKKEVAKVIAEVHEIFQRRGLTMKERDIVWAGMAGFCAYQLQAQRGPFYKVSRRLTTKRARRPHRTK